MQFHSLKRRVPNKRSMAVGRGGKRGKTSGRGGKGQTARAGHKARPEMRDVIKRLPKLRGRGKNIFQSIQEPYLTVDLDRLEKVFNDGDTVTPSGLVAAGVRSLYKGRNPQIKILSDGNLTKRLIIKNCRVSAPARVKIEKAGGKISQ